MNEFVAFVQDQLSHLDGVTVRPMFGAHGLYLRGSFFAIAYDDRLYLRTDDATRPKFLEAGMAPFRPPKGPTIGSYYEVPADVLDDRELLAEWAEEAAATHGG
ncbi:MAG TPA: TfoX/Sxy family protein [Acidimicrobiales bacterium]|nr:TfoX/Sxy family protein [Acidimicrobiales bacterium]